MRFLKPAWQNKKIEKALIAVEALTREPKIIRAAKESRHWLVREAAVNKLNRQAVLADIAVNDPEENVRIAAVYKLTAQDVLTKIATDDPSKLVCETAVNNIMEEAALFHIAQNAKHLSVRWEAFSRIENQPMPEDIAYGFGKRSKADSRNNK